MVTREDRISFIEENDATFVYKRRLQLCYMLVRNIITGVQYSIILPSAWQYLQTMHVQTWFYGLTLSMTPLAAIVVLPTIGWIYDKTLRGKELLQVLNALGMIGNLIYSLPFSPWLPLIGRFLTGFGVSEYPVLQGEISWTRKYEQRMKVFAVAAFGFFLGLSSGPAITLVFERINFKMGYWHINYKNFPGVFLALCWLIVILLTYFMYEDLAKNYIDMDQKPLLGEEATAESMETESDTASLLNSSSKFVKDNSIPNSSDIRRETTWQMALKEALTFEILGLLYCTFVIFLFLFEGESLLPLISQIDLGWNIVQTNLTYLGAGTAMIVSYVFLGCVGGKISDAVYMLMMMTIGALGPIFLLLIHIGNHNQKEALFLTAFIFGGMAEPFTNVVISSILSKVIAPKMQGKLSSINCIMQRLAHIAGPLYGTLTHRYMLWCNIVMTSTSIVGFLWVLVSIRRLRIREVRYGRPA